VPPDLDEVLRPDPIRFPPQLDNQLVELYNYVTGVDGYISRVIVVNPFLHEPIEVLARSD